MDKQEIRKVKEIVKTFNKLKNRIIKHREKCKGWLSGSPCFDCHLNTPNDIGDNLEELRYLKRW